MKTFYHDTAAFQGSGVCRGSGKALDSEDRKRGSESGRGWGSEDCRLSCAPDRTGWRLRCAGDGDRERILERGLPADSCNVKQVSLCLWKIS